MTGMDTKHVTLGPYGYRLYLAGMGALVAFAAACVAFVWRTIVSGCP